MFVLIAVLTASVIFALLVGCGRDEHSPPTDQEH
jgi:hypothetical protein